MSAKQRHLCPKCGYEYEPWVEICPDCGVLVETVDDAAQPRLGLVKGAMDSFGPDDDPHWKVVGNVPNAIIGNLIKSQLEDAGIPVLMRRSPSADIAQFSGNDYVPQDLLVPESKEVEARQLLDSAPDPGVGAPYWGGDYNSDNYDVWDEDPADSRSDIGLEQLRQLWNTDAPSGADNPTGRKLPDGWTLLPTERDVRARAQHQRAHGDDTQGWQWQESAVETTPHDEPYPPDTSQWQARSNYEYGRPSTPRLQRIERSDYDSEGWSAPSKWIRITYGILLLVLSLPFLFQLLQQLFAFLR